MRLNHFSCSLPRSSGCVLITRITRLFRTIPLLACFPSADTYLTCRSTDTSIMHTALRFVQIPSVVVRFLEFVSAVVVAGILGRFLYLLDLGHASTDDRIIYAEVIAGISIACSLVLIPPLRYSFYAFLLDLASSICWMVAFGLLKNVSPSKPIFGLSVSSISCIMPNAKGQSQTTAQWQSYLLFSFVLKLLELLLGQILV